ncbi:MAG: hypothetical protein K0B14_17240, partial [Anaerolineaceae bacterium]|nr:hypothetical protein [Anaerolineaceae bacterium]
MISIEIIFLGENELSGTIPSTIGNLINLQWVDIYGNQLSGSLPTSIGDLPKINNLNVSDNPLSGPIPSSFVKLSSLERFMFSDTEICEPIAPDFQIWKSSVDIFTSTTIICSPYLICESIVDVPPSECVALVDFYSSTSGVNWINNSNWLFSPIIDDWYGITSENSHISEINLSDNQLQGSLSESLNQIGFLQSLYLNRNLLIGSIPISFTDLSSLLTFDFSETMLCEPNNEEFLEWKSEVTHWISTG